MAAIIITIIIIAHTITATATDLLKIEWPFSSCLPPTVFDIKAFCFSQAFYFT